MAALQLYLQSLATQLNSNVSVGYTSIPATSTTKVGSSIQHISGPGNISTLSVAEGLIGPLLLIADGTFTFDALGNIAIAGTVADNNSAVFVWDGLAWYPAANTTSTIASGMGQYAHDFLFMGG